jgi:hypothetical protein
VPEPEFPIAGLILPSGEDTEIAPDGSIPMYGVYIVSYLDTDGDTCWKWHLEGSPDLNTIMGMVEMFKMRVVASTYDWDRDV